jgi:hypothetical protein
MINGGWESWRFNERIHRMVPLCIDTNMQQIN